MTYTVIIDKLPKSASENLAINLYIMENIAPDFDHVVRIYKHNKAVILGYRESSKDLNMENCKNYGYEVLKRSTGGSLVVASPESALCYSVFFNSNVSNNLKEPFENFVIPLSENLGKDFTVNGNYYIRYNGSPLAGHSAYKRGNITQLDGIVYLEPHNVDHYKDIFHLRELHLNEKNEGFVLMDGKKIPLLKGNDVNNASKVKSEKDELKKMNTLYNTNLNENDFIEKNKINIYKSFWRIYRIPIRYKR